MFIHLFQIYQEIKSKWPDPKNQYDHKTNKQTNKHMKQL